MHRDSIKLGDISPRNIIHQKSAKTTWIHPQKYNPSKAGGVYAGLLIP